MFSNYTLPSGLRVHLGHVSRTDEDGQVVQDRLWATVAQVWDQSHVHARIDVDVLQPLFRGLHFGKQPVDELGRRKRQRIAADKKEMTQKEQQKERRIR